jgi:RNA polymerase sigma-70 factor (family 1)
MAAYSVYTDQELTGLLKQGDHGAYTEIFMRYNRLLYGHAYKRIRNKEEAQDIVQEVFTVLWTRREGINISINLTGYLYTAIRNKIYNLFSHKQIESEYIVSLQQYLNEEYAVTDYLIREKQLQEIIENEMAALPPRMREVFELSRKKYLSHKEIAEKMGISESTVTDQVKKALKILKPKIGLVLYLIHYFGK